MPRRAKLPVIRMVEWIENNEVRVFFSDGRVAEVALPWVKDARRAKVVDYGGGLDPGDGKDVGADTIAMLPEVHARRFKTPSARKTDS